jgi:hypothetical protein
MGRLKNVTKGRLSEHIEGLVSLGHPVPIETALALHEVVLRKKEAATYQEGLALLKTREEEERRKQEEEKKKEADRNKKKKSGRGGGGESEPSATSPDNQEGTHFTLFPNIDILDKDSLEHVEKLLASPSFNLCKWIVVTDIPWGILKNVDWDPKWTDREIRKFAKNIAELVGKERPSAIWVYHNRNQREALREGFQAADGWVSPLKVFFFLVH